MKHLEILQGLDFEEVLNSLPGDYGKIRKFRSRLDEPTRELFDSIFLIGFREGLLLNLTSEVGCDSCDSYEREGYVRLGPSTLFRVPECYGHYNIECNLCPVGTQCMEGVELEYK